MLFFFASKQTLLNGKFTAVSVWQTQEQMKARARSSATFPSVSLNKVSWAATQRIAGPKQQLATLTEQV